MSTILGYVVQYSSEDDFTIYHGSLKLFRQYSDALLHAQELVSSYLETQGAETYGPFEYKKPTKQTCDIAGSVVIFQNQNYIIWIDCIVE